MSNEIADTIGKMREILIERGRCSSRFQNADGAVCLMGSLCAADEQPLRVRRDSGIGGIGGIGDNWDHVTEHRVVHFLAARVAPEYHLKIAGEYDPAAAVYTFNDATDDDNTVLDFLHEAQLAAKESHA